MAGSGRPAGGPVHPGYWAALAAEAERGLLDFATIEDALGLQAASRYGGPDGRADQVRGRLDAVLIAAQAVPATSRIGPVPTATTTHTEPFHVSTAITTLDYTRGLRVLQAATGADEILVTTITHDHADRVRSFELLAQEWGRP